MIPFDTGHKALSLCPVSYSSPLYRYMHENGLSFDQWTIHTLAVVAYPDTECGAQLETAMISSTQRKCTALVLTTNSSTMS